MSKVGFYTTGEAEVYPTSSLSYTCTTAPVIHTTRPPIHPGAFRVTLNQPTYSPGGTGVFCPKTRRVVFCTCPKVKQSLACVGHTNQFISAITSCKSKLHSVLHEREIHLFLCISKYSMFHAGVMNSSSLS